MEENLEIGPEWQVRQDIYRTERAVKLDGNYKRTYGDYSEVAFAEGVTVDNFLQDHITKLLSLNRRPVIALDLGGGVGMSNTFFYHTNT